MIQIEDVHYSYGSHQVLKGVSFSMEKGEFVCILGANGCGKTTLLKTILDFLTPQRGRVTLYGQDVHRMDERARARKIAYIPQYHTPPFPFAVRDVVLMGRTPHLGRVCHPTPADERVACQAMERLGVLQYADQSYTALSGGQRQMVVIARALAQQPDLLIMDEPTSSLDFGNQYLVLAQVKQLAREGMGVLMVTHNPDHAVYCADRIVAMEEGKILAMGQAERVIREPVMNHIYHMPIKVRRVPLEEGSAATVCIPVPELTSQAVRPGPEAQWEDGTTGCRGHSALHPRKGGRVCPPLRNKAI